MAKRKTSHLPVGCERSICPIANTLDIVGDKWTLLIVRDLLFLGKRRYQELADSPERIPTNILADRLKRLERSGLVRKSPYQDSPVRYAYTLTPKGVDLKPVLLAMIEWAGRHVPEAARPTPSMMKKARAAK